MSDPKDIAARLRRLATGTVEWRVQHPVDKSYCISFTRSETINPERDAHEWLADHQRRFPGSMYAEYEVAEVRYFDQLERTALEAADALDAVASPPSPLGDTPFKPVGKADFHMSATLDVCIGDELSIRTQTPSEDRPTVEQILSCASAYGDARIMASRGRVDRSEVDEARKELRALVERALGAGDTPDQQEQKR